MENVVWSSALRKEVKKFKLANSSKVNLQSSTALSTKEKQALQTLQTPSNPSVEIRQTMWF